MTEPRGYRITGGRVLACEDPTVIEDGAVVADGDRIAIRGGTKSVSEALAEGGVPTRERARWPVLAEGERILWIPGVRTAVGMGAGSLRIRARRTT